MKNPKSIIYLSYFLNERTPLYGGAIGINIEQNRSIENGDSANTKNISLVNHSGTHIDFPNHFYEEGLQSSSYSADFWIFKNPFLLELNAKENQIINLSKRDLEKIPKNTDFLIIKTNFGKYRNEKKYWKNNPGLSPLVASSLKELFPEIKVVGIDLISITSFQNRELGREAHRIFLGGKSPILLIEDMDLNKLNSTPQSIQCLPLLISKIDGSPVSIIATL